MHRGFTETHTPVATGTARAAMKGGARRRPDGAGGKTPAGAAPPMEACT